jgi:hypothetical protein
MQLPNPIVAILQKYSQSSRIANSKGKRPNLIPNANDLVKASLTARNKQLNQSTACPSESGNVSDFFPI